MKFLFLFAFLTSNYAQYRATQKTKIDVKRIIKEFVGRTIITSCFMECEGRSECHTIGSKEEPVTQERIHCYLLKQQSTLTSNDKKERRS